MTCAPAFRLGLASFAVALLVSVVAAATGHRETNDPCESTESRHEELRRAWSSRQQPPTAWGTGDARAKFYLTPTGRSAFLVEIPLEGLVWKTREGLRRADLCLAFLPADPQRASKAISLPIELPAEIKDIEGKWWNYSGAIEPEEAPFGLLIFDVGRTEGERLLYAVEAESGSLQRN